MNDTNSKYSIEEENLSVTPNPAIYTITIHCSIPIKEVSIFNVDGLLMLQTTQMQIDISRFPLGIYIIRAVTKDGQILQTKIIHK